MKALILGTGTSTGVPLPGCKCKVCLSDNPKNNRLRASMLFTLDSGSQILVDTSTDLRQQALKFGVEQINSVLYTHAHADHTHGIDDLRGFNFRNPNKIDVFAAKDTAEELERKFTYCFKPDPKYQGGQLAKLSLQTLEPGVAFNLFGESFLPLEIFHGNAKILGFRVRDFAYLTDCSGIPDSTMPLLSGLETLIIDGLRHKPHKTHLTVEAAAKLVEELEPKQAFLTHISHDLEHEETNKWLRNRCHKVPVELAYDGISFEF